MLAVSELPPPITVDGYTVASPSLTNVCLNPSFETGTVGAAPANWATSGPTITVETAGGAVSGSKAMKVVGTGGGNVNPGAFGAAFPVNATVTATIWVKGAVGGEQGRINLYDPTNNNGQTNFICTTSWQAVTVTYTPQAGQAVNAFYIFPTGSPTFYVDAVMIVQSSVALSYFDGDTPGYGWNGAPHASTSSNTATVTNLCPKPRFEDGLTTGWTTTGANLTSGATLSIGATGYLGTKSLQVTSGGASYRGAKSALTGTFKSGVTYVTTVRMKGNAGAEPVYLQMYAEASADQATTSILNLTTGWIEYRVSFTPSADRTDVSVYIKQDSTGSAYTWFIDAVGIFASSNNAGYFDGSFVGAQWTSAAYASTSTRSTAGAESGHVIRSIPDLGAWWNADDLPSADGTVLATWTDRTGKKTATTAVGSPTLKRSIVNGHSVVRFAGAERMTFASFAATDVSVFAVVKPRISQSSKCFVDDFVATAGWALGISDATPLVSKWFSAISGGANDTQFGSALSTGAFSLVAGTVSAAAVKNLYENGVNKATGTTVAPSTSGLSGAIGGLAGGGQLFDGDIAEIIVFTRALSTAERQQVEGYLAAKFALGSFGTATTVPPFFNGDTAGAWWMGAQGNSVSVLPSTQGARAFAVSELLLGPSMLSAIAQ